ncbi:MAG: 50S ribosomal protein L29 [Chloroflexi bacterium]|nr:50S ribosomal protein L29 [Chloroflexota bacterium]
MEAQEIRNLTLAEMRVKLDEAHQELFNLRFQWSTGQLKNSARLTQVKRQIALLETILRERERQEMGQEV